MKGVLPWKAASLIRVAGPLLAQLDSPGGGGAPSGLRGAYLLPRRSGRKHTPSLCARRWRYSAEQYYNSTTQIHAWAATADWQVPILKWFEVTGEAYRRSNAIGGNGGGLYKDVIEITKTPPAFPQINGVEDGRRLEPAEGPVLAQRLRRTQSLAWMMRSPVFLRTCPIIGRKPVGAIRAQ